MNELSFHITSFPKLFSNQLGERDTLVMNASES
jgi:hypothetical protein